MRRCTHRPSEAPSTIHLDPGSTPCVHYGTSEPTTVSGSDTAELTVPLSRGMPSSVTPTVHFSVEGVAGQSDVRPLKLVGQDADSVTVRVENTSMSSATVTAHIIAVHS